MTSEFSPNIPDQDSPLDINEEQSIDQGTNTTIINKVCQEVLKALKGQVGGSGSATTGSFSGAFAGNSLVAYSFMHYDQSIDVSWIVVTGASDHMSSQLLLLAKKGYYKSLF